MMVLNLYLFILILILKLVLLMIIQVELIIIQHQYIGVLYVSKFPSGASLLIHLHNIPKMVIIRSTLELLIPIQLDLIQFILEDVLLLIVQEEANCVIHIHKQQLKSLLEDRIIQMGMQNLYI